MEMFHVFLSSCSVFVTLFLVFSIKMRQPCQSSTKCRRQCLSLATKALKCKRCQFKPYPLSLYDAKKLYPYLLIKTEQEWQNHTTTENVFQICGRHQCDSQTMPTTYVDEIHKWKTDEEPHVVSSRTNINALRSESRSQRTKRVSPTTTTNTDIEALMEVIIRTIEQLRTDEFEHKSTHISGGCEEKLNEIQRRLTEYRTAHF